MGILDDVRRAQTGGQDGTVVDAAGRKLAVIPKEFTGVEIEIVRGDLARILYDRTSATCEYIFGDSITALTQTGAGVDVTFAHVAPRTFDLVIGADGIHSNVRRLAFGPEADYVRHLGYYYADVGSRRSWSSTPTAAAPGGSRNCSPSSRRRGSSTSTRSAG
jgi:2-polyprenyl-6-methoxyphenol hydroxylase-like FAD-dependent oxidoreductase